MMLRNVNTYLHTHTEPDQPETVCVGVFTVDALHLGRFMFVCAESRQAGFDVAK